VITLENRFFPLRSLACFVVEGLLIFCSVLTSFLLLRNGGFIQIVSFEEAAFRGVIIALFCQVCMYMLDLYDLRHSQPLGLKFFSLLFVVGCVCIGIGLFSYVIPEFAVEGRMYYLAIVFLVVLLLLWREGFDYYLGNFAPAQNILVVGNGVIARTIAEELIAREKLGFRFKGYVGPPEPEDPLSGPSWKWLGDYSQMEDIAVQNKISSVVVAITDRRGAYPVKEMLALKTRGYVITEWPGFLENLTGRILVDSLAPSYFIFNPGFRKSALMLFTRRAVSFLVALTGLIILAPFLLLISLLIRIESPGPIFYRQERVGRNGTTFMVIKFRSMVNDAEAQSGPRWATENDPRITRIGAWIRKFRVDEFPQLINILKGDLELVGPRPERPLFVSQLEQSLPFYKLRHTIRPGVTGWAQVMFPYCGTIEESKQKLEYDLYYIKNMSVKLDLLIAFRTVKILLLGRGAR
jgi:sugar transferase (PEP-CTERM system associated)